MPLIYLVSANPFPERPLRIDVEQRNMMRHLRSPWRVIPAPAARLSDLISDLRSSKPDVVHFSAHGSPTERLVLLDDTDQPQEVSRATLDALFQVLKGKIRLVVLNACYSRTQAELIAEKIDCVIGVSGTVKDTDGLAYSGQFYEALVAKRSIKKAHEEASIVLTDVGEDHKPVLISRAGVDADTVMIGGKPRSRTQKKGKAVAAPAKSLDYSARKEEDFDRAVARYMVWAERLTVLKIGKPDGSFVTRYELENVNCERGEIKALRWQCESVMGLVRAPDVDDASRRAGADWVTEPDANPASFEQMLKGLGTLSGRFVFDPPLKPGAARSLAWTVQVLNGDAVTAWEFENLYPTPPVHVNGKPLSGKASEYFAQLVWFPVRELRMGLRLPPSQQSRPQFSYFELRDREDTKGIPEAQIVAAQELRMYPDTSGDWGKQKAMWQRNPETERLEAGASGSGTEAELTVAFPILGSHYSLDWTLPDPVLPAGMDRLRTEAVAIRDGLVAHQALRAAARVNARSERIRELFTEVHRAAREFVDAQEPSFTTALMTWDREQRRLVTVEVCRNDGKVTEGSWKFWLPFGLGLAGTCFRTAAAFRYQHDLDRRDPERPENYLPVPGAKPHECLLSLPIDHPEMTEALAKQPNAQRCRQMVGVISLGSASRVSRLLDYCHSSLTDAAFERLSGLRDTCQTSMDAIARLLLTEDEEEPAAEETAGILLQPAAEWVPPVRSGKSPYRVVAFDCDGTLLRGEKFLFSWEMVWNGLGYGKTTQNDLKREYRKQASRTTSKAGRLQAYRSWCEGAIEKFKSRGLTRDRLQEMSRPLRLTKNCREALGLLRKEGIVTALVSGGIDTVLEDAFPDYREYFDFVFINQLTFEEDGVVSGVKATAYDFEGKADAVSLVCRRLGAAREEAVFVGDHFNDEAVMLQVKLAIAYPPSDDVIESVSHVEVREDDLMSLVPYILAG